jgi:hypothetical protein
MSTTEIGALIVSLRTESAEFRAEMDKARGSLKTVGAQSDQTSRQIAKVAADGFGAIIPLSFRAENALERFIERALKAQGAMALFGKSVLAVGVGLAAFKLGSLIGEMLSLGTTVSKYDEEVKKATAAEKEFMTALRARGDLQRNLNRELASVRGDELATFRAAEEERNARIRQVVGPTAERDRLLAQSAQIRAQQESKFFQEQQRLAAENEQKNLERIKREMDAQAQAWQQETAAYSESLQRRLKLRQDFEAQLGQGGFGGGAAAGFGEVRQLQERIRAEAQQLAFLEREGRISQTDSIREQARIRERALQDAAQIRQAFGALPAVLEAVDRAVASIEFGNFGAELQVARGEIEILAPRLDELQNGLGQFAAALASMPNAVDPASAAVRKLSVDYLNLANAIYQAVAAQSTLIGGAAPVQPAETP